jgi:hypothetical protein
MANVANMLDVSSFPVYLGIGPEQYYDSRYTLPVGEGGRLDPHGNAEQLHWLETAGVTHILALERMNPFAWPIELVWAGPDPLLTPVFNRSLQEPFFLYRLKTATGRVVWENADDDSATATITEYAPHRVALTCDSTSGGRLVLRDLAYPGWRVLVDGNRRPAEASGAFRAVSVSAGEHRIVWEYRPRSVYWGAAVSAVALVGLLSASVFHRGFHRIR